MHGVCGRKHRHAIGTNLVVDAIAISLVARSPGFWSSRFRALWTSRRRFRSSVVTFFLGSRRIALDFLVVSVRFAAPVSPAAASGALSGV